MGQAIKIIMAHLGHPYEGETIAVSDPVSKTCTGHALSWDRALKPEEREGVRLRFKLDRAKIYAFRFK